MSKEIKCCTCRPALFATATEDQPPEGLLLSIKTNGRLCAPSQSVFRIICTVEKVIAEQLFQNFGCPLTNTNLGRQLLLICFAAVDFSNLFQSLHDHNRDTDPCDPHISALARAIINKYILVRMCHLEKTYNRRMMGTNTRRVIARSCIFKNL